MMNTCFSVSVDNNSLEPFEDRTDILFRELELATKWQRPSVLLAVYSSEYVRADADIALENRLHNLGQSAYHIKIKNRENADVCFQISELANLDNVVFFVEGLRWGANQDACSAYQALNNRREFFIENQIRVVFWLTEKEAIDLAHYAPDYWAFRHRVIEFVDSPSPDQFPPQLLDSSWQWTGEFADTTEDLDAKIALRAALLTDLPSGNESTAARANLLLTLGILHWRKGDYEKATQFLNTALDLAARIEDACFEALCFNAIALVQTDMGRIEEAIQAYQNAISLAHEQISAWNNLGHLFRKLGRHPEALSAFQKAVEQNEADAVAWNGLGDVYHETKRNDDAIYAYLKATELSPDYVHSWSGLGNSHMDEGHLDEALAAHQKAIEIDRRTAVSWLGLGNIYRMKGNYENASMAFRTALELEPKNAVAWNELGHLFYNAGSYEEAMRSYQKSIEFNQNHKLTYGNLAAIYNLKGLHAQAIPLLLKGIEISADIAESARLWNQLGEAYRRLDNYDNAIAAFRKADELAPQMSSPQTEVSSPPPEAQPAPPEQDIPQPDTSLDHEPDEQEPQAVEPVSPAFLKPPEPACVLDDSGIDSARPDSDFMDWLDGLASVLPVSSPDEIIDPDISSPIREEDIEATQQPEPDRDWQIYFADQPDLQVDDENNNSNEPASEVSDFLQGSGLPFDEKSSEIADPEQESEQTIGEDNPVKFDEDQDAAVQAERPIFEETVSQKGWIEGEDSGEMQESIDGKNAQIWNELGNIYFNTGAFDEAMHAFEMAIELDPSSGWSYNNLASVHYQQKRYEDAIKLYQKGLHLMDNPRDRSLLWNRLGDAYRRLDHKDQAAEAYRKAIELDPDNVSLLTRARFSLLGNLRV
jgi:tetratricopeptide (TPR) repeat protein